MKTEKKMGREGGRIQGSYSSSYILLFQMNSVVIIELTIEHKSFATLWTEIVQLPLMHTHHMDFEHIFCGELPIT